MSDLLPGPRGVFVASRCVSCHREPKPLDDVSWHATRVGSTLEAAQRAIEKYGGEDLLTWAKENHGHGSYWSARGSARGPNYHMEYIIEEFEVAP